MEVEKKLDYNVHCLARDVVRGVSLGALSFMFYLTLMSEWNFIMTTALLFSASLYTLYNALYPSDNLPTTRTYLPVIGNTLDFILCERDFTNLMRFFGEEIKGCPVFKMSVFGTQIKVVQNAELAHALYHNKYFDSMPESQNKIMGAVKAIFGKNVIVTQPLYVDKKGKDGKTKLSINKTWKTRRESIKKMVSVHNVNSQACGVARIVENQCERVEGKMIDVRELTNNITMGIFMKLFLGIQEEWWRDYISHFADVNNGFIPYQSVYILKRLPILGHIFKLIIPEPKFFKGKREAIKQLKDRFEALPDDNQVKANIMDDGSRDMQILAERMYGLLFAGYDTTSVGMRWALYCLQLNPEYRDDITSIIKEHFDPEDVDCINTEPLKSKLDNLTFEITRLFPPIFMQVRQCLKSTSVNGYPFEKGDCLMINLVGGIHQDKNIWSNKAKEFDPLRWERNEDETQEEFNERIKLQKHGYLAFGGGYRICPGRNLAYLELKIFLCILLKNYAFEIEDIGNIKNGGSILNSPAQMKVTISKLKD